MRKVLLALLLSASASPAFAQIVLPGASGGSGCSTICVISTSLAIGGATIGSNALAVAGTTSLGAGTLGAPGLTFGDVYGFYRNASNQITLGYNGTDPVISFVNNSTIRMESSVVFGWSSGNSTTAADTILSRAAAATFQSGGPDAAAPVAQILQAQSVVAGNANTAGATFTIAGSKSNGSGGGDFDLQTTLASAGSGSQNTLANAIIMKGGTQLVELPAITTDAALTDTTVCQDITVHGLHAGSGTAGICLGNVSSIRFKQDWRTIDNGLDTLAGLDPGTYRYKPGIADGGAKEQYGFKAEDYAKVLPVLTRFDAEGKPNGVDMMGLIPVLVSAIKQQQAEIDALKARLP